MWALSKDVAAASTAGHAWVRLSPKPLSTRGCTKCVGSSCRPRLRWKLVDNTCSIRCVSSHDQRRRGYCSSACSVQTIQKQQTAKLWASLQHTLPQAMLLVLAEFDVTRTIWLTLVVMVRVLLQSVQAFAAKQNKTPKAQKAKIATQQQTVSVYRVLYTWQPLHWWTGCK